MQAQRSRTQNQTRVRLGHSGPDLEARDAGLSARLNVRLKSNLAGGGPPSYGYGMTDPVRVMLEQGKKKRVVACAFDWPGWDRAPGSVPCSRS